MQTFILKKRKDKIGKYFSIITGCLVHVTNPKLAYPIDLYLMGSPLYNRTIDLIKEILRTRFGNFFINNLNIDNYKLVPIGFFKKHSERTKELLVLEFYSIPVYNIQDWDLFDRKKYLNIENQYKKRVTDSINNDNLQV